MFEVPLMRVHGQKLRGADHSLRIRATRNALLGALLTALIGGAAAGQDGRPGGPGVITPSVWNLGLDPHDHKSFYFGYLDVRAKRGDVYCSSEPEVSLGELIRAANGSNAGPATMAHVIRHGASGIRIPWSPDSDEPLLPGDLVVFGSVPRDSASESAAHDRVGIGLVGLLDRRPIVIFVPRSMATVDRMVEALRQPPRIARTVRVIRTDPAQGRLRAGELPEQLVDGDVLVFDRARMDIDALARLQANHATQFPAAKPMKSDRQKLPEIVSAPVDRPVSAAVGTDQLPQLPSPASAGATSVGATNSSDASTADPEVTTDEPR